MVPVLLLIFIFRPASQRRKTSEVPRAAGAESGTKEGPGVEHPASFKEDRAKRSLLKPISCCRSGEGDSSKWQTKLN